QPGPANITSSGAGDVRSVRLQAVPLLVPRSAFATPGPCSSLVAPQPACTLGLPLTGRFCPTSWPSLTRPPLVGRFGHEGFVPFALISQDSRIQAQRRRRIVPATTRRTLDRASSSIRPLARFEAP